LLEFRFDLLTWWCVQSWAAKITGMLLELPVGQLLGLLTADELLRTYIDQAVELIRSHGRDMGRELSADVLLDLDVFNLGADKTPVYKRPSNKLSDCDDDLDGRCPLFWQPGKQGYYSLRPGNNSDERLNAFRNIGRCVRDIFTRFA
jgi:E3 ubiquitin-protein ligase EDD1